MILRIISYFPDLFLNSCIVHLFVNVLLCIRIYCYFMAVILEGSDTLYKTPCVFNRFVPKGAN